MFAQTFSLEARQTDRYSEDIEDPSHSPASLEAPVVCPGAKITVAYNAFIWPTQDWRFLIGSQLEDLADSGLLECSQMIIAISVPEKHPDYTYLELQLLMQQAVSFVREQEAGKDAIIIKEHQNSYEYPAINSLYRIAMSEPDDAVSRKQLFMYFHTKGMVNHGVLTERVERLIFNATVIPWRGIVQQFLTDGDIQVAGFLPSIEGFVWSNFWWVRGSWVKHLGEPTRVVEDRWHWEWWVTRAPEEDKVGTKVFSICSCDSNLTVLEGGIRKEPDCLEVTPDTCLPVQIS